MTKVYDQDVPTPRKQVHRQPTDLVVGDIVYNIRKPDWGSGEVISIEGVYVTVKFKNYENQPQFRNDGYHLTKKNEQKLELTPLATSPEDSEDSLYPTPFNNVLLRDWFFRDNTKLTEKCISQILVVGDGPFGGDNFANFSENLNSYYDDDSSINEIIIIGTNGWEEELSDILSEYRGKDLQVYSQEMFLSMLNDNDPYDNDEILTEFTKKHPALQFIIKWGFHWPTTTIVPSKGGKVVNIDWPQIGMLKYKKYQVGEKGISFQKRKRILQKILTTQLPDLNNPEYMEQWGDPSSARRLKKMADTIASIARNAKRKQNMPIKAIEQWEHDLAYLKTTYYRPNLSFSWPST